MSVNIPNAISNFFRAAQPDTTKPTGKEAAPGAMGTIRSKIESAGAQAKTFVLMLGQAPRALRALYTFAMPRTQSVLHSLRRTFEVPARAERRQMAAQRELLTACRRLFQMARQDYGVPVAGQVARMEASLDRLLAAHGPNTPMSREVLLNDTVRRALDSLPDGKFLRSMRGLGDTRTLTHAERDSLTMQLKQKLPDEARQRIVKSLAEGDAPRGSALTLLSEAVALYAPTRTARIPSERMRELHRELAAENDKLVLARRPRPAQGGD